MNYYNKHILILGMGVSGQAAAELLLKQGAQVTAVDRQSTSLLTESLLHQGLKLCSEDQIESIQLFDGVVVSPGVAPHHFLYQAALQANIPVMGEIALGCQFISNPVIGVTGTNGKTTVTLLVTHVLNHINTPAIALGNIGVPLTRRVFDLDPKMVVVLELSSYQLETLNQSVLDTAVILNVTPDHLDRYGTMEAYAQAKWNITKNLKPDSMFFCEEKTYSTYFSHVPFNTHVYGYTSDHFIFTDLEHVFYNKNYAFTLPKIYQYRANHDVENIMAAYGLCQKWGVKGEDFCRALECFRKPPHRIEFVREYQGIFYFDDSKGTNLDAVIRAVQSLEGSIILIAGGVDKGAPYTPWIEAFANKVKCICAIGQAADKIAKELSHAMTVIHCHDLKQAVKCATEMAHPGDNILLSPGCASYDMFKDYAHRGREFQKYVNQL